MPSNKRLKDLEYNVFGKNRDNHIASDNFIGTNDKGCLTLIATVLVFIVVIVCIIGFTQIDKNGPALTCAAPGCSNRLKPGSNYCWLHSSQGRTKRTSSSSGSASSSSSSSSGNGSVIGGSSSSTSGETKKRSKIWGGEGNNKSKDSTSTGNSSSSGSSSSSGGGSSTGN